MSFLLFICLTVYLLIFLLPLLHIISLLSELLPFNIFLYQNSYAKSHPVYYLFIYLFLFPFQ